MNLSTSGSDTFIMDRDQIIREMFELLGEINLSDNLPAEDIGKGSRVLNLLVKSWEADGVYLWKETLGTLFYVPNKIQYTLGPGGDHATNSYIQNLLSASGSNGTTTLILGAGYYSLTPTAPTTGMSVGDNIGIQLDTGVLYWTTIASITNSTTVTITSALPSSATAGNYVYSYTNIIDKPLHVTAARRRAYQLDQRVNIWARDDYFYIPNKNTQGVVSIAYYKPEILTGEMFLFMAPYDVKEVLQFSYFSSIQDFDNSLDDPDFPVEWTQTIIWCGACMLAPVYGKYSALQALKPIADQMYENLREWSHDHTYIETRPNFDEV